MRDKSHKKDQSKQTEMKKRGRGRKDHARNDYLERELILLLTVNDPIQQYFGKVRN